MDELEFGEGNVTLTEQQAYTIIKMVLQRERQRKDYMLSAADRSDREKSIDNALKALEVLKPEAVKVEPVSLWEGVQP